MCIDQTLWVCFSSSSQYQTNVSVSFFFFLYLSSSSFKFYPSVGRSTDLPMYLGLPQYLSDSLTSLERKYSSIQKVNNRTLRNSEVVLFYKASTFPRLALNRFVPPPHPLPSPPPPPHTHRHTHTFYTDHLYSFHPPALCYHTRRLRSAHLGKVIIVDLHLDLHVYRIFQSPPQPLAGKHPS